MPPKLLCCPLSRSSVAPSLGLAGCRTLLIQYNNNEVLDCCPLLGVHSPHLSNSFLSSSAAFDFFLPLIATLFFVSNGVIARQDRKY